MVTAVNEAFMKFQRRAEAADAQKLVETFVDVGPLMTLMGSTDHQILYGRRGTGKTHALSYLAEQQRAKGDVTIYVDLRTIGSTAGTYNEPNVPLPERATRLLSDVLCAVHDHFLAFAIENLPPERLGAVGRSLDALAAAAIQVNVVGAVEQEEVAARDERKKESAGLSFALGLKPGAAGKQH